MPILCTFPGNSSGTGTFLAAYFFLVSSCIHCVFLLSKKFAFAGFFAPSELVHAFTSCMLLVYESAFALQSFALKMTTKLYACSPSTCLPLCSPIYVQYLQRIYFCCISQVFILHNHGALLFFLVHLCTCVLMFRTITCTLLLIATSTVKF